MEEIWKPVVGFEEYYAVSNLGNVKSFARIVKEHNGRIKYYKERIRKIKGTKIINDYKKFSIDVNRNTTGKSIARAVLEVFKPIQNMHIKGHYLEVNHINGIKYDNRLENLEWVTPKSNKEHAFRTGLCNHRRGEVLYCAKLKNLDIPIIRQHLSDKTKTMKELTEIYKVNRSTLYRIKYNKGWKHIK